MRFAFIKDHREEHPVGLMCQILRVSRAGFYAWLGRPASERQRRREDLAVRARAVHEHSRRTYGSPRVHAALVASGARACRNTVAKVMREQGIRSKLRRRFVARTTDSSHPHAVAENLLGRDFAAAAPDRKWACDITYVPTGQGWLYLAVVIDLCSRRVVGRSMAEHLRAELCTDALRAALRDRRPAAGLLHHSDRGVQYACGDYRALLSGHGIACSMSRRGDCYDNAVVESFFKTLKAELVHDETYENHEQARLSIFQYIECWYNRRRLHSSLGYKTPEAFEAETN